MQLTGNLTLLAILQNGDSVFREQQPASTGSLVGGGDSGANTADPGSGDGGCGLEIC